MNEERLKYLLEIFEKDGDDLISEHEIRKRVIVQNLGLSSDNSFDCVPVRGEHLNFLEGATGVSIDLSAVAAFVSCVRVQDES